jgi:hypothetical protein
LLDDETDLLVREIFRCGEFGGQFFQHALILESRARSPKLKVVDNSPCVNKRGLRGDRNGQEKKIK